MATTIDRQITLTYRMQTLATVVGCLAVAIAALAFANGRHVLGAFNVGLAFANAGLITAQSIIRRRLRGIPQYPPPPRST